MAFWDERPRFGANCMNDEPPSLDYLKAARGEGVRWIRLAWDKWKGSGRDFLLGNADRYEGLAPGDVEILRAALDRAQAAGLKVVVVPLSLPGMRWRQNNGGAFDGRIWRDKAWWEQAARYWRDLAACLKGHPALVAYNLVNEPAPEAGTGLEEDAPPGRMKAWYGGVRGTARDLPAFSQRLAAAYLEDVLSALDARRSHWAFYSFREPYDGFDYELGTRKLPWGYWKAQAEGRSWPLERGANPVFHPISRRLKKGE